MELINAAKVWSNIEKGIKEIYQPGTSVSVNRFMELYENVFTYCTKKHLPTRSNPRLAPGQAEKTLYSLLSELLKKYSMNLLYITENLPDNEKLNFYTKHYEQYKFSSKVLNGVCGYFNHNWIARQIADETKDIYKIYDLALKIWGEHIFTNFKKPIMNYILKLIKRERNGETINSRPISDIVSSFIDLGFSEVYATGQYLHLYKTNFEEIFIQDTKQFYLSESKEFLRLNPVTEYMKKIESRLIEENRRLNVYLHASTGQLLLATCQEILIKNYLEIFETEFQNLLFCEKNSDLARMYFLLSRIPDGCKDMEIKFEHHVYHCGISAIEKCGDIEGDDSKIYIETILNVFNKYMILVNQCFNGDVGFQTAFDKACRKFINKNSVTIAANTSARSPELLAKYCDLLLKNKNEQEAELEHKLSEIKKIFIFIDDKDVFQKFYTKMLAKRLVSSSSASHDAEASMISKMRDTCGYEYTNYLQKMLQDISISKGLNEMFKTQDVQNNASDIDFSILVASSGFWPFKHHPDFTVPSVLESSIQRFNKFYSVLHSGRKLIWMYNTSKVEIVTTCFKNRYTIQASTFQLAILLQFNEELSLTIQQLHDNTKLALGTLIQILQILLKAKLLTCTDSVDNLTADSIIKLFLGYKNKKLRININIPLKSEKKIDEEDTYQRVEQDRNFLIQAAIVRIMKTRRTLGHNMLIAEVLQQLAQRFKAKVSNIKKCIDLLIEKEYIGRNSGERNSYNYLT